MFTYQHPWRTMFMTFGGVLLFSAGIQSLFSPLGNVALRAFDTRDATFTGVVAASGEFHKITPASSEPSTVYRLSNPERATGLMGRAVRVSGVLHPQSGVLDITCIAPVDQSQLRP